MKAVHGYGMCRPNIAPGFPLASTTTSIVNTQWQKSIGSTKHVYTVVQTLLCLFQVVEAVQYCMSMGVLHRDVKDENILIDLKTSQIKLIDFGSGTFLKEDTHVYTEYEGMYTSCNDTVTLCCTVYLT